ncbi:MAG: glycoside hydrolase family 16 protein [Flavobacterium sp.]|nr:glycoside hydrolase family 16 protein [Flavobacterium sp.]
MKNFINKLGIAVFLTLIMASCQEDDHEFGNLVAPTNLQISRTIVGSTAEDPLGDGSGIVNFIATANDAISYQYVIGASTINSPSGILQHRFNRNGTNTYLVTVVANGRGGVSTSTSFEITVRSDFSDPETTELLTGGNTKVWYWAASELGHLGVGPNNSDPLTNYYGNYYQATPFEKAGSPTSSCLYENILTFKLVGDEIRYTLDNGGQTFFNTSYESVVGGSAGTDTCYDYDVSGEKVVTLSPSESVLVTTNPTRTTGTAINISDNGFMGYYIGTSTYEVLSITENRMVVRAVMGNDPALAWYHTFSTSPPVQPGSGFTTLVFEDNFEVSGAPNPANWTFETGAGGWGNNELQHYRDGANNAIVENGVLKITAKKENFSGSAYTSARIKSENKFEFTYGKVEVRAKLPEGAGTWPAIWMLGANFPETGWPQSGEIDIMEHRGTTPGVIHSTLHLPGNSAGDGITGSTTISNVSSEFHVYSVEWTATTIRFFVDGTQFHSFANSASTPFNADFFLILNVAMGGTFGGAVDPGFVQSTMEIDYVKVYQ